MIKYEEPFDATSKEISAFLIEILTGFSGNVDSHYGRWYSELVSIDGARIWTPHALGRHWSNAGGILFIPVRCNSFQFFLYELTESDLKLLVMGL